MLRYFSPDESGGLTDTLKFTKKYYFYNHLIFSDIRNKIMLVKESTPYFYRDLWPHESQEAGVYLTWRRTTEPALSDVAVDASGVTGVAQVSQPEWWEPTHVHRNIVP